MGKEQSWWNSSSNGDKYKVPRVEGRTAARRRCCNEHPWMHFLVCAFIFVGMLSRSRIARSKGILNTPSLSAALGMWGRGRSPAINVSVCMCCRDTDGDWESSRVRNPHLRIQLLSKASPNSFCSLPSKTQQLLLPADLGWVMLASLS